MNEWLDQPHAFSALPGDATCQLCWLDADNGIHDAPDDSDDDEDYVLGPCGCTDYHMADCPLVTDRFAFTYDEPEDDPYDYEPDWGLDEPEFDE
jgi:hypothetical protein